MENLRNIYGKVLSKKNIWWVAKWAYVVEVVKQYIHNSNNLSLSNITVSWYVKHNFLVICTNSNSLKTEIFLNKKNIIEHVNTKLQTMWYENIVDMRVKLNT